MPGHWGTRKNLPSPFNHHLNPKWTSSEADGMLKNATTSHLNKKLDKYQLDLRDKKKEGI